MTRPTPSPETIGFAGNEEGGITVLSLFLFLCMLVAAGLAVDINNMVQARAQLQGAADAAGHAALYWRWRNNESASVAKAVEVAEANMPKSRFGDVLANVDVEFGWWDVTEAKIEDRFKPSSTRQTAARVTTRRNAANSNGLNTFLMKFIGQDVLDVETVSVWDHEEGWCPRGEGFFAVDVVDVQSNNKYYDGFCMHSDTHVELQNNNYFQDGVKVTMPDQNDLIVPLPDGLDPSKNPGLVDALDSVDYNLTAFFNNLPNLVNDYRNPYSHVNSSLTDTTIYNKTMKANVTAADIVKGAINVLSCTGKSITIDNNVVISDAVVITDCEIKFNSGAAIENATLITTNTGSKSINAPSGFRVGDSGFCSNGGVGGANLLTMGSLSVASGFEAYGANVIAAGDISITSNANGLAGINFMANGRIDATANGDLGFCNEGPPKPFVIPVFRMVM